MNQSNSFERIRREVARDMQPVRPLLPPWLGALAVLPLAILLLCLVWFFYGLRSDVSNLGPWLGVPVGLMVVGAYAILYLALFQRSPEYTTRWVWWALVPLSTVALQIGGGLWTLAGTGPDPTSVAWQAQASCFWNISVLAIPVVLIALWMLARGFPLRPPIAGLLAGLGAGFLAEGFYRMHCRLSDPSHIVPWHTGAVLGLGMMGLVAGLWWERWRVRSWSGNGGAQNV